MAPVEVSPTEPEMVTPWDRFCSAPTLRSHLSSLLDNYSLSYNPISGAGISDAEFFDWSVS